MTSTETGNQGASSNAPAGESTAWKRPRDNGFGHTGKALLLAAALSVPFIAIGAALMKPENPEITRLRAAGQERTKSLERLLTAPPREMLPVSTLQRGRELYATSCAACHSPTGRGVTGLGKDLVGSWFMAGLDDSALHEFIRVGRPADAPDNTTRIPMPPMGGQQLSEDDIASVVAYMRGLQDPRRMPELPAFTLVSTPPSSDEISKYLHAAGGDEELAEYIASGSKLYASSCAACHGADGRGVQGNGKSLVDNPFCNSLDDDELLAFIKRGRDPGDPANTTGVGMPAKGGNPALDDDDILDIIAYVRALEQLTAQR
jgi:mono/diheme cytochrome c family protein